MPSATRNTKANSGKPGSAPAKWNTCSNTSALTPSAAPKDSSTVRISSTGATSARSSSARTTRMTASTIGMIRFRSCRDAWSVSYCTAAWPPTRPSAPGPARGRAGEQQDRRADPRRPRPPAERGGEAPPHAVGGDVGGAVHVRRPRPEDPPAEQRQEDGQEGQHHHHGAGDADGADRAEAAVGVELAEAQAQQAEDDRRRRRPDRRRRPAPGAGHGLDPALVGVQLLAVAADQQQRVVGAGPDDQDGQDARSEEHTSEL